MNYIAESLIEISITISCFVIIGIVLFWLVYNNREIKKAAIKLIKRYAIEAIFWQTLQTSEISLYGIGWKKTLNYSSKELRIKLLEFKIELLKSIFKINERQI